MYHNINITQKLWAGAIGSAGIVGILFIMGFILKGTKISEGLGNAALYGAVFIGIIMGILGIAGILKKLSY